MAEAVTGAAEAVEGTEGARGVLEGVLDALMSYCWEEGASPPPGTSLALFDQGIVTLLLPPLPPLLLSYCRHEPPLLIQFQASVHSPCLFKPMNCLPESQNAYIFSLTAHEYKYAANPCFHLIMKQYQTQNSLARVAVYIKLDTGKIISFQITFLARGVESKEDKIVC